MFEIFRIEKHATELRGGGRSTNYNTHKSGNLAVNPHNYYHSTHHSPFCIVHNTKIMPPLSGENEQEYTTDKAFIQIPLVLLALLLLVPVFVVELVNRQPVRSRIAKQTRNLMFGVIACNTIHHLIFILSWLACGYCKLLFGAVYITRSIVKGCNLLFLVHRCKVAQGMAPVLSRKWFEKIFPAIIVGIVVVFIAAIIYSLSGMQYVCKPYNDTDLFQICRRDVNAANEDSSTRITGGLAIGVDMVITTGLMYLFIVPLYRVYRADIGVMNDKQLKERLKLKRLLIWSVVLTLINQLSSSLLTVQLVHVSHFTMMLHSIGQFDPVINVWSSWLMILKNRQFLWDICCCTRRSSNVNEQTNDQQTGIIRRRATDAEIRPERTSLMDNAEDHSPQMTNDQTTDSRCAEIDAMNEEMETLRRLKQEKESEVRNLSEINDKMRYL